MSARVKERQPCCTNRALRVATTGGGRGCLCHTGVFNRVAFLQRGAATAK
jgi:hypothetical protein